jgi:5-methylcytosine-specific restriction endonuclease McrA
VIRTCGYCDIEFVGTARRKFCSAAHGSKAHLDADRDRRRATRKTNQPAEIIFRTAVFVRDGWMCQLCGDHVDKTIRPMLPMGPTLDHIVPLARGGLHVLDNVQLAHRICNMRKGARVA